MTFATIAITGLETQMIIKVFLAALLGSVLGYERERHERPAGLRTHMLVSMGATIFSLISIYALPSNADPGRMAAYVIVGIGFIGAGTVIQLKDKVMGLTTASSLWLAAAIGITVATEYYFLAIASTIMGIIILSLKGAEQQIRKAAKS